MRLLLFNLATDADDPILGFTTRWIGALAARLDFIHVVTMRAGRYQLPANVQVHSVGKEKNFNEPRRAFEFYRILLGILRGDGVDVCFSHMMPLFTVMAAPLLKVQRIPVITWYAHPSIPWMLWLAHRMSSRMVASIPEAYPYRHDKLTVVGHGIDTDLFTSDTPVSRQEPPLILCVGRLSPMKDHPTLLRAAALLKENWRHSFRVMIVGGPAVSRDRSYVRALHEQAQQLGLAETVEFVQPVSLDRLPPWYAHSTVNVNLSPIGSGDKVVWEALACGKLCLFANPGFTPTFGDYAEQCRFSHGNPHQLAERLLWALSLTQDERAAIGAYLRERVVSMHGLDRLAQKLVELFQCETAQRRYFYAARRSADEMRREHG